MIIDGNKVTIEFQDEVLKDELIIFRFSNFSVEGIIEITLNFNQLRSFNY